jgi:RHS repeat-associated protein
MVGNPVNLGTGNKFQPENDYTGSGSFPLAVSRYYNSDGQGDGASGVHWSHTNGRIVILQNATEAKVYRADGEVRFFNACGTAWCATDREPGTLTEATDASGNIVSWAYTDENDVVENYDGAGVLVSETSRGGFRHDFAYIDGYLSAVSDSSGRFISYTYDTNHRINEVTLPDGQVIGYSYDSTGDLSTVTYPDGHTRTYVYDEAANVVAGADPGMLTGIIDENGQRFATYRYDGQSRVVDSEHALLAGKVSVAYGASGSAVVTNALGAQRTYGISAIQDVYHVASVAGGACAGCTNISGFAYNAVGDVTKKTDFNSVSTLLTPNARHLAEHTVEAFGTSVQRTTDTTWDPTFRLPSLRTVKGSDGVLVSKFAWTYNARGQAIAQCDIDPLVAPSYVCAATGIPPAGVRRNVFTYCDAVDTTTCPFVGLLLETDGPRTDVADAISYAWYPTTDESGCSTTGGTCHHLGDLKSITDSSGLVTTYVSYDKIGRVTRVKDTNGILTDFTYTPRGWLASKTIRADASGTASSSDSVATVAYDPTGTVHSVTDPDGVVTTYTYDAAHRLTDITDVSGNHIHYTLDAAGNRTSDQVLTSAGTVVRSLGRTFNALGQLTAVTDGLNSTVFSAGFADSFDANGNLIHSQDGLGHQTKQAFDGLNRLVSTLQNYQGTDTATANSQTVNTFDALDRVGGFSDPDGLNTTYDIDAFGNPTALHSPDTGTTSHTFDVAGNALTSVDATNNSRSRTYDADNRLLTETFADTSLNVQYKYDEADTVTGCTGGLGKGHLTRVIEGNGGIVWCYDHRGNVATKRQTVGTVTRTTTYAWTTGNRLASVTTPNGTSITYTRNALGQIASIQATPSGGTATTVVSNVVRMPFGSVASYMLGDGQNVTLTYDANGAWTDVVSTAFSLHVKRDVMGNIIALGNAAGVPTPTETYSYDPLYRLTGVNAADGSAIEAYTYNKTGDRLSKTAPGLLTGSYNYAVGTHHLTGVGTTTRVVDARGNTTADVLASGTFGYGYNGRNRLTVIQNGGVTVGSYVLNALGQRVQKTAAGVTTRFDYDEDSRLLSENAGTTSRDYVWMDGMPVGIVDHTGTTTVNFVHADGLGSPRAVTNSSGALLWQWAYASNPFGERAPASATGYVVNLRFPGQYFDAESGLNYNVNRDYEPAVGRYLQSDPTGLAAGPATYLYVNGNPLMLSDSLGLSWEQGGAALGCGIGGGVGSTVGAAGGGALGAAGGLACGPGAPACSTVGAAALGTAGWIAGGAAGCAGGGAAGAALGRMIDRMCAANDDNGGDDYCKKEQSRLDEEYRLLWEFTYAFQEDPDGMQQALIRQQKIDYNRQARLHNSTCPMFQVPLFLVRDPSR